MHTSTNSQASATPIEALSHAITICSCSERLGTHTSLRASLMRVVLHDPSSAVSSLPPTSLLQLVRIAATSGITNPDLLDAICTRLARPEVLKRARSDELALAAVSIARMVGAGGGSGSGDGDGDGCGCGGKRGSDIGSGRGRAPAVWDGERVAPAALRAFAQERGGWGQPPKVCMVEWALNIGLSLEVLNLF